ncbi:putative mediator of RNA polymerase II transcription subunit 26 isoform X2 [Leptopilina boulardi]|uniref:putative mediator of RNA polymerase II transcription subunit 26 isoform X2 n=1 Tax=Leptopilina boulardi TaxID=63433 RepID=UPI0021F56028|nr:putative mediator of RNA polymerase II transcription subunit 26 isoform X2 [Leptopilina boulardi]
MVSQHAMATTVRKVKQGNRLRKLNQNQDEEEYYKPVPPPKPVSNNQKNNQNFHHQHQHQTIVESYPQVTSGQSGEDTLVRNSVQTPAPEYRMPPLYGDEQSSNQAQQASNLQTHSSKFPIEREVVLSSGDKNSKIPILHEYKQRSAGRAAIAPDAPISQQAWVQEGNQMQELRQESQRNYQSPETYSSTATGAVPRTTKVDEEKTKTLSKTYHTIKDMISSRFGPNRKEVDPEPEASLNNVTEELRKSTRDIEEDEIKKKDGIYGKPRAQDSTLNMQQQYSKNSYGQYGHSYGYQGGQQTVPLPGQLQSPSQIQPSLPGQSAQLHVTHHTPPGGVQMAHQTQISGFVQSTNAGQPVQNVNREYVVQGTGGMNQQSSNAHQSSHQSYQSPQQLLHQSQHHQSPRFAQQHAQNMHQRQLIQQMHQQQQQQQQQQQLAGGQQTNSHALRTQNSHFPGNVSYQQFQQARQPMSRSQIDLPSTSRQTQDLRVSGQEIYYHYAQGRPRYGVPQVYMKPETPNQEVEYQRQNTTKGIEKAASQPHLSFEEERLGNNESFTQRNNNSTEPMKISASVDPLDKEKYEITVEEHQMDFGRSGSQRKDEYRPETSFGIRREEARSSKREQDHHHHHNNNKQQDAQNSNQTLSVQKRIEELQKKNEQDGIYTAKLSKEGSENEDIIRNSGQKMDITKRMENSQIINNKENYMKNETRNKDDIEHGIARMKIQGQGSGSDYDKAGQSSSNVDSGRGSAVYSSGRRPPPENQGHAQGQDSEWVDIVESELRSILEPRDVPAMAHSTLSESVSSVTPPLPPLSPHGSPRTPRNRYSASLPYGSKPNYNEYSKGCDKRNYPSSSKHRGASTSKKDSTKKFSHLFGVEAADLTSTTTGLDLDSMLDRSDSDLSTNDARTIRKQLEGLENMYSEVLKLLGGSVKKKRKSRGLTSYGSVSSLPTSSVSSRPVTRHHDKRRSHAMDDRMKKVKDIKSINKRFQRLESHVVTLARSVAHLSSEMRTQHLMMQEMENIRGEIAALRTQTSMAMVRSQSQPLIKDSELPALSNPSRVKKLTKFFGTEPPLIRLFLRELGYEKYAGAFEKERVGMVELPYLSEERLQKMGVPLGPRLRILQEARISVLKDPVYVV